PPAPAVTIALGRRQATATPNRVGFTHTGAGNIDVQQPTPDAVVITMTGVAVAGGHPCQDSVAALTFDLLQDFEVTFAGKDATKAKLRLEARVIGLLRSHAKGGGAASITCPAEAVVAPSPLPLSPTMGERGRGEGRAGAPALAAVALPGRSVAAGENLSVND